MHDPSLFGSGCSSLFPKEDESPVSSTIFTTLAGQQVGFGRAKILSLIKVDHGAKELEMDVIDLIKENSCDS